MTAALMPRRVLKEFTIDELSAVDHPAQRGASATIMKRQDPDAGGGGPGRRNVMRKFVINEISAVDHPANAKCEVAVFKRAAPPPEPGLEAIQPPDGETWRKRRERALEALQAKADTRAVTKGITSAKAYSELLDTDEGRALYAATV